MRHLMMLIVFGLTYLGESLEATHTIDVFYDDGLGKLEADATLKTIQDLISSVSGSADKHINLYNRKMLNLVAMYFTDNYNQSDHIIILVQCNSCLMMQSNLMNISQLLVICIDEHQQDILKLCELWLLENKLWGDFISALDMEDVIIFYDETTASSVPAISASLQGTYSTFLYDASCDVTIDVIMQHNHKLSPSSTNQNRHNFIISTSTKNAKKILAMSSSMKLTGPDYNWLTDLRHNHNSQDFLELTTLMQDGDNNAIVTISDEFTTLHDTALRDSVLRLLYGESMEETFNNTQDTYPAVMDVFKCVTSCVDGNLTRVSSVYSNGSILNQEQIFPEQFMGFHGRLFKAVVKTYEPFINQEITEDGEIRYTGMCVDLLDAMAEALDFRYELFEVLDGKFGVENETGHWNGLIGTVARGEADFSPAAITITSARDRVIDYTFPYWEEPSTVLLRRPGEGSRMTTLFRPFKILTWCAIFASVLLASLFLYFVIALNERLLGKPDALKSFWQCLLYCYAAIFAQSLEFQPLRMSSRMVASCWWLTAIVIYAVYTGNLIAFLAVTIDNMPFNTLEEMVAQSEYYYGLEDGIVHQMLFKEATSGVYSDIWKGITANYDKAIVRSTDIALDKMKYEKYAFIGEKTFLETKQTDCDLIMIEEEFFKSGFAFAVPDGWPFTKYFNEVIMSMVETGFIGIWKKKHWRSPKCNLNKISLDLTVTDLHDISGGFLLLLIGGILAMITLLIEIILNRCHCCCHGDRHARRNTLCELEYTSHPSSNGISNGININCNSNPYTYQTHMNTQINGNSSLTNNNNSNNIYNKGTKNKTVFRRYRCH